MKSSRAQTRLQQKMHIREHPSILESTVSGRSLRLSNGMITLLNEL